MASARERCVRREYGRDHDWQSGERRAESREQRAAPGHDGGRGSQGVEKGGRGERAVEHWEYIPSLHVRLQGSTRLLCDTGDSPFPPAA